MSEIHSSVGASGRSWVAMWSDMLLPPPHARARAQYAAESPTKSRDSRSPFFAGLSQAEHPMTCLLGHVIQGQLVASLRSLE